MFKSLEGALNIQRTLKGLEQRKLIWSLRKGQGSVIKYGIQKKYTLWNGQLASVETTPQVQLASLPVKLSSLETIVLPAETQVEPVV